EIDERRRDERMIPPPALLGHAHRLDRHGSRLRVFARLVKLPHAAIQFLQGGETGAVFRRLRGCGSRAPRKNRGEDKENADHGSHLCTPLVVPMRNGGLHKRTLSWGRVQPGCPAYRLAIADLESLVGQIELALGADGSLGDMPA